MRRRPATEAAAAAEATRRRLRSRFLRPRRMVEKQCTFWLYTKCSIYVHCTLYIYMAAIWYMYGSGWVKIVDGLPAGPYDEPCKGLCFLSSFFSLVASQSFLTYLFSGTCCNVQLFCSVLHKYASRKVPPPLLAVSKSSYKRAGLATTYCETY